MHQMQCSVEDVEGIGREGEGFRGVLENFLNADSSAVRCLARAVLRQHVAVALAHVTLLTSLSCPGRRRAPRLDESIVQGVTGAEPAMHCCFIETVRIVRGARSV